MKASLDVHKDVDIPRVVNLISLSHTRRFLRIEKEAVQRKTEVTTTGHKVALRASTVSKPTGWLNSRST